MSFESPLGTKDELIEGELIISRRRLANHAPVIKKLVRLLDPEGAPELAIKVVSASNTRKDLLAKIRLYLRHGSSAV